MLASRANAKTSGFLAMHQFATEGWKLAELGPRHAGQWLIYCVSFWSMVSFLADAAADADGEVTDAVLI